jgi:5-formyltetrahydrofolate cyclo-ligase
LSEALLSAKRRLRKELSERRRAVTPDQAARAGDAVKSHLEAWGPFRTANRVALYAALPDELPTRPCFEALAASGRTALLPRVASDGGLGFRAIARWEDLQRGRYGVLTPPESAERVVPAAGDLVLVPGLAFDLRGMRLGRGGGHYDRAFAAAATGPLLCGVAYGFQLIGSVPHGSHDRRMDAIVTERGLHAVLESG